jgi:iron-sulfur cluster insertion protein
MRAAYTPDPRDSTDLGVMGLQFPGRSAYVVTMGQFAVTDRAATRIAEIAAAEGNHPALRVSVLAGGCSGFQYRFELDKDVQPDDLVIEKADAKILVDPSSLDLLAGSELDFTDALMGSHFAVKNPNATSSCGCGTSFSIE